MSMNTWLTIGDLQHGIEAFLLKGDQPMRELCIHAAVRGVREALVIHNVHALRDAGRLEIVPENGHYRLSTWNRAELERTTTPEPSTAEEG